MFDEMKTSCAVMVTRSAIYDLLMHICMHVGVGVGVVSHMRVSAERYVRSKTKTYAFDRNVWQNSIYPVF